MLLRYSIIIFAGTAAFIERKQSTSVNKLYWYTSMSVIVQVESVSRQRYARGALTCSLLICVFPLWAFLHSNKAVLDYNDFVQRASLSSYK